MFKYHPTIGYTFIENFKNRIQNETGGYLIKTNKIGFRSDYDFNFEKDFRKRILLFGDSFTAADAVSNNQRFSNILEREIANLEVYNFGMPGTGTDQQYLIYQEFGRNYQRDLIIVAVLVENIRRISSRYRIFSDVNGNEIILEKPFFNVENNELVLLNKTVCKHPLNLIDIEVKERKLIDTGGRFKELRKLVSSLGIKEHVQRLSGYQPVPDYNSPENFNWKKMKLILEKWADDCDCPLIIMPIPLYQHIEGTATFLNVQRRFCELQHRNIIIHDLYSDLMSFPLEHRKKFRFVNDIHPTPLFHQVIANSIAKTINKII